MKIVATMSLPAVYRPNDATRTTTAGTPYASAKMFKNKVGGHNTFQFATSGQMLKIGWNTAHSN